jgi:transposase
MRRIECSTIEKAVGQRLRLLNPRERLLAQQTRLRRLYQGRASEADSREFYPVVLTSGGVPMVSDGLTLAELDKKTRLLVARIAGVGAALAIGFLAAGLFRDS